MLESLMSAAAAAQCLMWLSLIQVT